MSNRIDYLDGLRGIAILLVIGFHAYAFRTNILPYGDEYQNVFFFKNGWVGVQLFFLISGFVILLTLEKCAGFKSFIYRRWLRLFPAMLIASFLIYFTSEFLWERPSGEPKLLMLLPGLSFVEPGWWRLVLGVKNLNGIEGSFWTLYAEMKFYVFAAIIYYRFGRTPMIVSLFFVYLLSVAMHFLANLDESVYFATLDKVFPDYHRTSASFNNRAGIAGV